MRLGRAVFALFLSGSGATAAAAPPIKLKSDFIGMAVVEAGNSASRLAVFEADDSKPKRQRSIVWFEKLHGKLAEGRTEALPVDAAAYDVCNLGRKGDSGGQTLLLLRKNGVHAPQAKALVAATTPILAHARDDALPRIKLCFDVFPGEPPLIAVPTLTGVTLFREESGVFRRHAELSLDIEARVAERPLRGGAGPLQVRFEYPELTAADFNGDSLLDLCANRAERLQCFLQHKGQGFQAAPSVGHDFPGLSDVEEKDTSLRFDSKTVDVNGDGLLDVVLIKGRWSVLDMSTELSFFIQERGVGFRDKPTSKLEREGYFAYHEFFDWDGDGMVDIVAPVADLGLTELAAIFVSRSADVDFVWYKNDKSGFGAAPKTIHEVTWPIDFKNMQAILGALPLWNVRLTAKSRDPAAASSKQALFFPGRSAVEVYDVTSAGVLSDEPVWREKAVVGGDVATPDLDGDGLMEIVFAYPRDPERARTLLMLSPSN